MVIFPISTDVHDGKIRLAAIEIIIVCVLVHIIVTINSMKVSEQMEKAVRVYQEKQREELYQKASPSPLKNFLTTLEDSLLMSHDAKTELNLRLDELRNSSLLYKLAFIPAKFSLINLITCLFVHGDWLHLLGNLLFFYVCGVAMEKYWGYWRFIFIYLTCGVAANLIYMGSGLIFMNGNNLDIPLVGASGAIAGIMGAFVFTHTKTKVKIFYSVFYIIRGTFPISAYLYFGFWFLSQIVHAISASGQSSNVAYSAHIGGFMVGLLFGKIIKSEEQASRIDYGLKTLNRPRIHSYQNQPQETLPGIHHQPSVPSHSKLPENQRAEPHTQSESSQEEQLITQLNFYFQSPEEHRQKIVDLISNILNNFNLQSFPATQIYQWAKNLSQMNLVDLTVACFDLAARTATNIHIKTNSLLSSSFYRMKHSFELKRAADDLNEVVRLDNNGINAGEAKKYLEQLKSLGKF